MDNATYVFYNDMLPTPLPGDKGNKFKTVSVVTMNNGNQHIQQNYDSRLIEVDGFDLLSDGYLDPRSARELFESGKAFEQFAIKSKKTENDAMTFPRFKKEALKKLMNQFLKTPDTKDTVLTRKNIIEMIKDLDSIGI